MPPLFGDSTHIFPEVERNFEFLGGELPDRRPYIQVMSVERKVCATSGLKKATHLRFWSRCGVVLGPHAAGSDSGA